MQICHRVSQPRWLVALALPALLIAAISANPAAAQEQAQPADSFVNSIGVNVHLHYTDRVYGLHFSDIIEPRLKELGIRHYRDGATDTNWQPYYDRHNALGKDGLHGTFILNTAEGPSLISSYPSRVSASFEAYEPPNEYDNSGDPQWETTITNYQKMLWTTVKSNPATAAFSVLGPSLGSYYDYTNTPSKHLRDLSAWADYGNVHPYPYGGNYDTPVFAYDTIGYYFGFGQFPSVNIDQYPLIFDLYQPVTSRKPLIATETGYFTGTANRSVSELAQGKYLPRLFAEYFRKGFVRTFSYELIDEGTDPADQEQNYGLLHNDGSPKPAFTAVKNLIGLLKEPGAAFTPNTLTYTLTVKPPNGYTAQYVHHLLLQKSTGDFYLVLWNDISSTSTSTVNNVDLGTTARDIAPPAFPAVLSVSPYLAAATICTLDDAGNLSSAAAKIVSNTVALSITDKVMVIRLVTAQPIYTTSPPTSPPKRVLPEPAPPKLAPPVSSKAH